MSCKTDQMSCKTERSIYLVLSSTPYKTGSLIRAVTGNPYNHVSLSLSPSLFPLYSFARVHLDIPLYGGFVIESAARFHYNNKGTTVKIYQIPLSDEDYEVAKSYIESVYKNRERYLYNLYAALLFPLKISVPIPDSFTCIDFAVSVLSKTALPIKAGQFFTIRQLEILFKDHLFYEGPMQVSEPTEYCESFLQRHSFMFSFKQTLRAVVLPMNRLISSHFAN